MLTDKRIIECEDFVRGWLRVLHLVNKDKNTKETQILTDTAEALAELLRWRERSNQIAKELSEKGAES